MPKTTISTIVIKHLTDMGADGLCNVYTDCGCKLDDLFPCNNPWLDDCVPAMNDTEQAENLGWDFYMTPIESNHTSKE